MRISDWSSDVCSSDLHVIRTDNSAGAVAITEPEQRPLRVFTGPADRIEAGPGLHALGFMADHRIGGIAQDHLMAVGGEFAEHAEEPPGQTEMVALDRVAVEAYAAVVEKIGRAHV